MTENQALEIEGVELSVELSDELLEALADVASTGPTRAPPIC